MAIIYTYPVKSTANDNDLILISDSQDSNKTKQIKIGDLPGGSSSGVSSVTATLPVVSSGGNTPVISLKDLTGFGTAGQVIKVNSGADGLEWGAAGGSTLPGGSDHSVQYKNGSAFAGGNDLTFHPTNNIFSVKHTVIVKGQGNGNPAGRLKLNCEQDSHAITLEGPAHSGGTDYTLKLPSPAPSNQQILQSDGSGVLSWINTPSSGGGGSVDSVNTTDGTFVNLTPNSATTGAVTVTADLSATGTAGNTTFLRGDNQWAVPVGTTYSAGTGLVLNGTTFSLATGAALTNLGGGSGTTFLRKDGTWATPDDANTNIANSNLQLDNNRNLDLSNGDAADYGLTFISTLGGVSKNLFKFDQIGGTSPRFTVGHTESAYEGYIVLEGNGSNRTGILQFENAAGTYYTSIKAPTTFGANQNIAYTLPNLQGSANSVLTNNGSGTLSWGSGTEEGTWTPSPYVPAGSAPTTSVASGTYIKVGDLVNCYFYLNITSTSSANVPMIISGLPFSASNTNGYRGMVSISRNDGTNFIQQQPTSGLVSGNQATLKRPNIQASNPSGTTVSISNTETIDAGWFASASLNYILEGTIIFKV